MVLLMLFISVVPLFKLTMRWYLYVPSSFFSILLAIIIIKSKARSKILYFGMLLYLGLFIIGCMINYNTWINNAKTSKILVDGLLKKIKRISKEKNIQIQIEYPTGGGTNLSVLSKDAYFVVAEMIPTGMAIKYENISATKHMVKDKVNLPLKSSLIFILRIQLSPKSCFTTISEIHFPYRYRKGLSKPKRTFSASISSNVICEP